MLRAKPLGALAGIEPGEDAFNVVHLGISKPGVQAEEEGPFHDRVSVLQIPHDATGDVFRTQMSEVAAEQVPRLDPVDLEEARQVVPAEPRIFPHRQGKTEP